MDMYRLNSSARRRSRYSAMLLSCVASGSMDQEWMGGSLREDVLKVRTRIASIKSTRYKTL